MADTTEHTHTDSTADVSVLFGITVITVDWGSGLVSGCACVDSSDVTAFVLAVVGNAVLIVCGNWEELELVVSGPLVTFTGCDDSTVWLKV